MDVRVDNKVLLVTGAAQGVGRAVALEAVHSGAAAVVLTDRDPRGGAEIASLGAEAGLFDRLFAVNTRAPMLLMQGVIRHLQERKASGLALR